MIDSLYLFEHDAKGIYTVVHRADKVLYDARSQFQKIVVLENNLVGRAIILDGVFNVSTVMEAHYHEPMAHIPLAMVGATDDDLLKVLVIGGGDFGVAKHVLKHPEVESVLLCELDPRITDVARKFFPEWSDACDGNKRFDLTHKDGLKYLEDLDSRIKYDAIIIDTTDPSVKAPALLEKKFYQYVYNSLRPGGVMMQIIGDLLFYKDAWRTCLPNAKDVFDCTAPVFVPIPFYLTGCWGLLLAGRGREILPPTMVSQDYLDGIRGVQTITPELVAGWFSLPPWVRKRLNL